MSRRKDTVNTTYVVIPPRLPLPKAVADALNARSESLHSMAEAVREALISYYAPGADELPPCPKTLDELSDEDSNDIDTEFSDKEF